jgi:hypothetical protein
MYRDMYIDNLEALGGSKINRLIQYSLCPHDCLYIPMSNCDNHVCLCILPSKYLILYTGKHQFPAQ